MAARRSRTSHRDRYEEEDDGARRRRPVKKGGSPVVPILAVLVLVGVVAWVADAVKGSQEGDTSTQAKEPEKELFSSVADEAPPGPRAVGGGSVTGIRADESVLSDPDWVAAKALAEQGYALAKESKDAETAGDTELYQSKAGEALAKFDKALEDTAVWEETLVGAHGDGDKFVAQIVKTRTRWFNQLRKLRSQAK